MKRMLLILSVVLLVTAACGSRDPEPVRADNTAKNAQTPAAQTPLDQGENQADLEITANIRKAIVADDSLSTNAHNVKIITSGGAVTLRGPVKSRQEKDTIEAKAKQVAGVRRVDNFLEIE